MPWYAVILVPRNEECNIHMWYTTPPTAHELARLTRHAGTILYAVREGTIEEAKRMREDWLALPKGTEEDTSCR